MKKLISPGKDTWKIIPLYILNKTHLGINILGCNCTLDNMNKFVKSRLSEMSMFYRNLLKVWFSTNVSQNIDQVQNWENQVIWSNECITTGGKTLYFKEWIKRGIILVSDLYNHEGEFMLMDEITCKFENGGSACLKYLALYQAIPRMWKKTSDSNYAPWCMV